MVSISKTVLALAVTASGASVYRTTSDCFTLEAYSTNGTRFGFVDVGQWFLTDYFVYAGVVEDSIGATKLGIDPVTGALLDLNDDENFLSGSFHHGRIAAVERSGTSSDNLWFKNLQDQGTQGLISVKCELDYRNVLSCTHPFNSDYNVFGYYPAESDRTDDWPALRLGTSIDSDCLAVIVVATAAQGCVV